LDRIAFPSAGAGLSCPDVTHVYAARIGVSFDVLPEIAILHAGVDVGGWNVSVNPLDAAPFRDPLHRGGDELGRGGGVVRCVFSVLPPFFEWRFTFLDNQRGICLQHVRSPIRILEEAPCILQVHLWFRMQRAVSVTSRQTRHPMRAQLESGIAGELHGAAGIL